MLRRLTFGGLLLGLAGLLVGVGLGAVGSFQSTNVSSSRNPASSPTPPTGSTNLSSPQGPAQETAPTALSTEPLLRPSAPPLQAFQAPSAATIDTIFTTVSGQPVTITWPGTPGTRVQFQDSADGVTWHALQTVAVDASGRATYTFTPALTKYYRASTPATGQVSTPSRGVVVPTGLWTGYVLGNGPYTAVTGTFTVPNLLVPTPVETRTVEWVGIDGISPSTSLIQAGVSEGTTPGTDQVTFQAWWEILPDEPTIVPIPWSQVSVLSGHSVTVTIWQVSGSRWAIGLTDNTTGQSFTTVQNYDGPHTSAEWIVEAPADTATGGVYTLGHVVPDVTFSNARFVGVNTFIEVLPPIVQGSAAVASVSTLEGDGFTVGNGGVVPGTP